MNEFCLMVFFLFYFLFFFFLSCVLRYYSLKFKHAFMNEILRKFKVKVFIFLILDNRLVERQKTGLFGSHFSWSERFQFISRSFHWWVLQLFFLICFSFAYFSFLWFIVHESFFLCCSLKVFKTCWDKKTCCSTDL